MPSLLYHEVTMKVFVCISKHVGQQSTMEFKKLKCCCGHLNICGSVRIVEQTVTVLQVPGAGGAAVRPDGGPPRLVHAHAQVRLRAGGPLVRTLFHGTSLQVHPARGARTLERGGVEELQQPPRCLLLPSTLRPPGDSCNLYLHNRTLGPTAAAAHLV